MAPDKSLDAEIEARAVKAQAGLARAYELIADQYGTWSPENGTQFTDHGAAEAVEGIRLARELHAEIAALQSRAFEDGARWMRERAKLACLDYGEACLDRSIKLLHEHDLPRTGDAIGWADAATGCARLVEALPLKPEGERNA